MMFSIFDSYIFPDIIIGILVIALALWILTMSRNIKYIKEKTCSNDIIIEAQLKVIEGKYEEAKLLIKNAFLKDCVKEMNMWTPGSYKCESHILDLENRYTRHFIKTCPDISKEYLHTVYLRLMKFYSKRISATETESKPEQNKEK